MRKTVLYYFILFYLFLPFNLVAQSNPGSAGKTVKAEQENFLRKLRTVSADSAIIYPLARFFQSETSEIMKSLRVVPGREKDRATRSLVYFMQELSNGLEKGTVDIYDIPRLIQSYKNVLRALLFEQPLAPVMRPMEPYPSQIMATVFSQYKEYSLLDDIAVYKRVAARPEFILQFLEGKPGFRYADSLLLEAAANQPLKMAYYLNRKGWGVQERIRNTDNAYLKQISLLAENKQVSELMPFLTQLAENKMTVEEILQKRSDVTGYFQLMVNTLQDAIFERDPASVFLKPLRSGIKEKALSFYVNEINAQHNSADAIRFASVKGLRSQDLYYIMTTCGDELYTSSYLGLYKRLMEPFRGKPADSLFELVHHDELRPFMRLAANYNVLADLLQNLSAEKRKDVLHRFIGGIESDESTALEKAMDIADSYTALVTDKEINELIQAELRSNLNRVNADRQYLGIRLYGILSEMFDMMSEENGLQRLWARLGDYEVLKHSSIENEKSQVTELVLFYGDEDGISSYNNFLRSFSDNRKWEVTKNNNWVSIRSLDQSLLIFANRPLDAEQEMDIRAQDSLIAFLREQSLEPTVLVHRGHSYHLDKTMKRISPSVKLAILGSCGGYNRIISIASINPDIQVIGSKKTGSKSINDPILETINEAIVDKKDLVWPEIWKLLNDRFSKDETALNLFNEYFPPGRNMGLFVLKLYKYYNRSI